MSNRTAIYAAIRRATLAAQREVVKLDAASLNELKQIYQQAADDLAKRITSSSGADGNVALQEMRSVLDQVNARLKTLSSERDALLDGSLSAAADMGTKPLVDEAAMSVAAAMKINHEALQFVRTFVADDGLQLSDRIWRLDRQARDKVTNAIEMAVIQGHGAVQAAREFLSRGEPVPIELQDKIGAASAVRIAKDTTDALLTGNGSPMDNAMRLMRTEINRAHGEAYAKGALDHPDAAGLRFLLSPGHPKPDVCLRRGTLVTTKRGDVPIEQIVVGDMALTHQGRFRPVTRLYRSSSGQNGLVRLCCRAENNRNLEAVMTPNHPVLTPQGWTPAGDLKTGFRVVCFDAAEVLQFQLRGAGASRKGLTNSGGIASAGAAQNTFRGLCDALRSLVRRTPRIDLLDGQQPTCLSKPDVATRLSFCCRLSMPDFHSGGESSTATAGIRLNAQIALDGAFRSSGLLRLFLGSKRLSNILRSCDNQKGRTAYHTSGRVYSLWHGLLGSRQTNRIFADPIQFYGAARRMFFGMMDRQAQPACPNSFLGQSTGDCKTAWLLCATLAPTVTELVQAVWRNIRKVWWWTCGDYIQLTPTHTTVELLPATGEEVFNIEVDEDHSYIANGIVVHNCDLLATQNLYGLGPGVYPTVAASGWPAHPNTLSFLEVVFKDEVSDQDKDGKETPMQALERLTPAQRIGVLGANKHAAFKDGKLTQGMIKSTWSAVRRRIT